MPSPRKVVTRSPHRRVGYVPCTWLQPFHIEYESLLERSFIHVALLCPQVHEVHSQPFRLALGDYGTYVPDFLLKGDREQVVVEVKPRKFVPKHAEKLNAAKQALEAKGLSFVVCTEQEIWSNDRHERAGELLRYARSAFPQGLVEQVIRSAQAVQFPISVDALATKLGVCRDIVLHLVGRRHFQITSGLEANVLYLPTNKESIHGDISLRAWIGSAD